LVVFGRSLGGAVGIELASRFPNDIKAIIIENTFLSIPKMVDVVMPYISFLKSLILTIGWHNDKVIGTLKQPIMFISSDSDELVPPLQMKMLHDLAINSQYKDFYTVFGGHHNDAWELGGRQYYEVC
jgi:pimeloyl-ACP methyl ester carboxylesterase